MTMKKTDDDGDSRDEDGGADERCCIETSLAVGVLPLSLVHLPSTVLTAPTHTEAHADDGCEDHKDDSDGGTDEKSSLVVDPLRDESGHPLNSHVFICQSHL